MRPVLHTAPLLLVLAGCSTPEPQESTFVLLQADDATLLQAPDEPTGDLQVTEADPPVLLGPTPSLSCSLSAFVIASPIPGCAVSSTTPAIIGKMID